MPLDEGIEEVVTILSSYYDDGGRFLVQQYGDQAPTLAAEMADMLGTMMQEETPFGALWVEYTQAPHEHEAELIGALEVLEESVPEITIRLEGYYAGFVELQKGPEDLIESTDPDDLVNIEELGGIDSRSDFDNDDEYNEENAYLVGNVEDRSTSALYIEGLDTSIEPNESDED